MLNICDCKVSHVASCVERLSRNSIFSFRCTVSYDEVKCRYCPCDVVMVVIQQGLRYPSKMSTTTPCPSALDLCRRRCSNNSANIKKDSLQGCAYMERQRCGLNIKVYSSRRGSDLVRGVLVGTFTARDAAHWRVSNKNYHRSWLKDHTTIRTSGIEEGSRRDSAA